MGPDEALISATANVGHKLAALKQVKFGATSEQFGPEQKSLLEAAIDVDLLEREVRMGKLQRLVKLAGE